MTSEIRKHGNYDRKCLAKKKYFSKTIKKFSLLKPNWQSISMADFLVNKGHQRL